MTPSGISDVLSAIAVGLVAVAVAVLTVYGEFRSISSTIERIGPLRALDRLGRLPN